MEQISEQKLTISLFRVAITPTNENTVLAEPVRAETNSNSNYFKASSEKPSLVSSHAHWEPITAFGERWKGGLALPSPKSSLASSHDEPML